MVLSGDAGGVGVRGKGIGGDGSEGDGSYVW